MNFLFLFNVNKQTIFKIWHTRLIYDYPGSSQLHHSIKTITFLKIMILIACFFLIKSSNN
jgi:hypothetical protein